MAKGKNAAALFEVINRNKGLKPDGTSAGGPAGKKPSAGPAQAGAQSTPTAIPRWWFQKSKKPAPSSSAAPTQASTPAAPAKMTPPPAVSARKASEPAAQPSSPAAIYAAPAEPAPIVEPPPQPVQATPATPPAPAPRVTSPEKPSAPKPTFTPTSRPAHDPHTNEPSARRAVAVEADRGEVEFRLTYTTLVIALAAVVVAIVLAVMVGKRMGDRPAVSQTGVTSQEIQSQPARPEVLNARPDQRGNSEPAGAEPTAANQPTPSNPPSNSRTVPLNPSATRSPGEPFKRTANLNYVILQSYDSTEEDEAREVMAYLETQGVPTTLEKKVPGFGNRLVLVSVEGFPPKSPELSQLIKKIDRVSAEQAREANRTNKKWRLLNPLGYRWR